MEFLLKKKFFQVTMVLILGVGIFSACSDDEATVESCDSNPSYSSDIRPIIDNTCALSGCHVSGFASGDFMEYAGVKERVDNNSFLAQVESGDMPPATSPGPTSLTTSQIDLIKCWVADGAPNN